MATERSQSQDKKTQNRSPEPVTLTEFYTSILQSQVDRPPLVFLIPQESAPASRSNSTGVKDKGSPRIPASSHKDAFLSVTINKSVQNFKPDCRFISDKRATKEKECLAQEESVSLKTKVMTNLNRNNSAVKVPCSEKEILDEKFNKKQNCVTVFKSRTVVHHPRTMIKTPRDNSLAFDHQQCTNDGVVQYHSIFGDLKADRNYSYFDSLWNSSSREKTNWKPKTLNNSKSRSSLRTYRPDKRSLDSLNSSGNSYERNHSSAESEDLNITRQIRDSHIRQSISTQFRASVSPHTGANNPQKSLYSQHQVSYEKSTEDQPLTTVIRFSKDQKTYYVGKCNGNAEKHFENTSSEHEKVNPIRLVASTTAVSSGKCEVSFVSNFGVSSFGKKSKNKRQAPGQIKSKKNCSSLTNQLKSISPAKGNQEDRLIQNFQSEKAVSEDPQPNLSSNRTVQPINAVSQLKKSSVPSQSIIKKKYLSSMRNENLQKNSKCDGVVIDDSTDAEEGASDSSHKIQADPNSGLFLCRLCPFKAISESTLKQHRHLHEEFLSNRQKKPEINSKLSSHDQNSEVTNSSKFTINPRRPPSHDMQDMLIKHQRTLNSIQGSNFINGTPNLNGNSIENKREVCSSKEIPDGLRNNEEKLDQEKISLNYGVGLRPVAASHIERKVEVSGERMNVSKRPKLEHGGYCCRFCNFTTEKVQFMASHVKICTNRQLAPTEASGFGSVLSCTQVKAKDNGKMPQNIRGSSFRDLKGINSHTLGISRGNKYPKSSDPGSTKIVVPVNSSAPAGAFGNELVNSVEKGKNESVEEIPAPPRVPYRKFAKPFNCPWCPFSATKMKAIRRHLAKQKH